MDMPGLVRRSSLFSLLLMAKEVVIKGKGCQINVSYCISASKAFFSRTRVNGVYSYMFYIPLLDAFASHDFGLSTLLRCRNPATGLPSHPNTESHCASKIQKSFKRLNWPRGVNFLQIQIQMASPSIAEIYFKFLTKQGEKA
jgi:hypothetical protein